MDLPDGFNSFPRGLSFEFWAYPTAAGDGQRFLDLGNGAASDNISLYRRGSTNDLSFSVYNGSAAGSEVTASNVLELNRWQFFAVTLDAAGFVRIYKNGVPVASGQTNVPNDVLRTSNYIGRSNRASDAYYTGGLDEAVFYDQVLSSDRIAAHYGGATGQGALLDRGNVAAGRYAVELAAAKNVTLRNLSLTGGEWGFVANDADNLAISNSRAFNNAVGGFYVHTDVTDALLSGNEAYGTTGNSSTDQDTGFQLRGDRMNVFNNRAYKVGAQLGDGIDVDSADQLVFHDNQAYNNVNGITIATSQAEISGNETRDNIRGLYVSDDNGNFRSLVHDNYSRENNGAGFYLENNVEAFSNTASINDGAGIFVNNSGDNTVVRDNYTWRNGTGISAKNGFVQHNRVVGNTGAGIFVDYTGVLINGNIVYGNARGIEVTNYYGATTVQNNLVYDNTNQGIYVHGAGTSGNPGVLIVNNTVQHEVGSALKLENNGNNVRVYNNIIVINGGLGMEVIGNVTGFDSNYNDIFPARAGANIGKYLTNANSATLASWQTATGKDASSKSGDPLFIDINGADNLFGWERPDPQSPFADFGLDDNFHLRRGSPVIDSADGETGPDLDADGNSRLDDLATTNTGNGVFRFYEMGAFEFVGSSADITPPTVTALLPVGLVDNALVSAHFSALIVRFSEPLEAVSARSLSLYSLIEAGPDGVLGNGDDVSVPITSIAYVPGELEVRVNFAAELPQGRYRLTLSSGVTDAIVDQSGNALDGDANGSAGGNFVRSFQLDLTPPTVVSVNPTGSVVAGPARFIVVFSEDLQMNAATVTNPANYGLFASLDETFGNTDDTNESARIASVTYDAASRTATVNLTSALPARHYQFVIRPSVTDQAGNALGNGAAFVSLLDVSVPVLNPIGEKTVYDGNQLKFTANVANPGGGILAYTLGSGAPAGASITTGGVFTWTPTEAQAGAVYKVKIIVKDNSAQPLSDSETIIVTVLANPAPVVKSVVLNDGGSQRSRVGSLVVQFSDDVSASLALNNLTVHNLTTNADVALPAMLLSFDAGTNQAKLTFPGLPNQKLADGNYRLTVTGVIGAHGKPMASTFTFTFHVLTGDVNGDRVTNDRDLYQVWQELLKPAASRNLANDLNNDGLVNQADLGIIKSNYLAALPVPPAGLPSLPTLSLTTAQTGIGERSLMVHGMFLDQTTRRFLCRTLSC